MLAVGGASGELRGGEPHAEGWLAVVDVPVEVDPEDPDADELDEVDPPDVEPDPLFSPDEAVELADVEPESEDPPDVAEEDPPFFPLSRESVR
ncbi:MULTISPECIES: hypothetical protein [Miniimonas]|uniref:hypothetical protein n=1 Tax=Miniimonas TaxID=947525 RepID=UPI0028ADEBC8|nr:hypothetical protein [Miniimonas arenae]